MAGVRRMVTRSQTKTSRIGVCTMETEVSNSDLIRSKDRRVKINSRGSTQIWKSDAAPLSVFYCQW